jgi:hypothetical protein
MQLQAAQLQAERQKMLTMPAFGGRGPYGGGMGYGGMGGGFNPYGGMGGGFNPYGGMGGGFNPYHRPARNPMGASSQGISQLQGLGALMGLRGFR